MFIIHSDPKATVYRTPEGKVVFVVRQAPQPPPAPEPRPIVPTGKVVKRVRRS